MIKTAYQIQEESESNKAKELAEAHWKYIESVLEQHCIDRMEIDNAAFHYKTAFVHGFKHGVEETEINVK